MNAKLTTKKATLSLLFAVLAAAGCSSASANESGAVAEPNAIGSSPEAVTQAAQGDAGAEGARHHGFHHHGVEGFFKRFDQDGDGKVAIADLPPKLQEHLKSADTNNDGFLTRDEMKAAKHEMIEKMKALMDTDGDGKVSPAEREAAHAKFKQMRFQHMDKNGDGFVTADEVGDTRWEHLKSADTNGDGKIDATEFAAYAPHAWHSHESQ